MAKRRTPEQNKAIYDRRNERARQKGYKNYSHERKVREVTKRVTGKPLDKNADLKIAALKLTEQQWMSDDDLSAVLRFDVTSRDDWTRVYSP